MQLEGRLAQFPLRELIEMVAYSSVKGMLEVRLSDGTGHIYFRDGLPYHARVRDLTGMDAICVLFEQQDAPFRFYAGASSDEETLWLDPWELLERGEELARAWAPIRPFIPNMRCVPILQSSSNGDQVHINEEIWPVLAAVDGQRSVSDIVDELRVDPLDVCRALVELQGQGLIEIRPPQLDERPAQRAVPDDLPGAARGDGFFERLIARTLEQEGIDPDRRYLPPESRYVDADR